MTGSRVDDEPEEEVAAPVDELSVHIGEDGLPTMTQVPIEEYRREVMAHLAYIAQARDAVARMTDASARAAKADGRVERARCSAESSKALEDLKAATSVLEALRPKGPLLTPEQRSKLRVLTPEERARMEELSAMLLDGDFSADADADAADVEAVDVPEEPISPEFEAKIEELRTVLERARLAARVHEQGMLLAAELKAVIELDRSLLMGALLQSRTPTGSS